jgi:hypothetical protein
MASTEIVQNKPPLPLANPKTPPESSALLPSSEIIEIVKAVVSMGIAPPSQCPCSHTPPNTPNVQTSSPTLTLEHLEQLLLKLIGAMSKSPDSVEVEAPKPDVSGNTQPKTALVRASKLEIKIVDEVYVPGRA